MFILKNRSVLSVSGSGGKKFLQGLLTNDLFKLNRKDALFCLMLNPKGRVLYDFFIVEKDETCLLVECDSGSLNEILDVLFLYKLNHEVVLSKTDYKVCVSFGFSGQRKHYSDEISFTDPRSAKMGERIFSLSNCEEEDLDVLCESAKAQEMYERSRIENCITDVHKDMIKGVSFPLEYRMDYAFSFNKGCYIGQEITARFRLKGETSKKLYVMQFLSLASKGQKLLHDSYNDTMNIQIGSNVSIGDKIKKDGEIIGEIRSMVGELALVYCNIKSLKENISDVDKILESDNCIAQVLNY